MLHGAIRIQLGLPPDQLARATELYWQAFGTKLNMLMGPEPLALKYLRRVVNGDHCLCALDSEGLVLGIAGFKTPLGSFASGHASDLQQVYGRWGAFWRGSLLQLLVNDVDNHRFLVDGIAVCPSMQGRGIGTALLAALCEQGLERGYKVIRLEVVDSNIRAQKLYEREGFYELKRQKMGFLRFIFQFSGAIVMIKPLKKN